MRLTLKILITVIIVLMAIGAGWWYGSKKNFFKPEKAESSTIMLESVKKVTRLITIEAGFSEIYDYRENYSMDIFNLFSKKALLRVTAKASIGFDFKNLNISFDSLNRTVTLNEWPQAEVLAVDHDLDYYDISQGTFNKFSKEEYNLINKKAKELILKKANSSALLHQAEQQREDFIFMLEIALKSIGWKLNVLPENSIQG